jgi:hypothetical protein
MQLIVFEIEDGDRLACAGLLRAVSLVQEGRVTAIGTKRDGGRKTVDAPNVSRDGES